jgi:hypothetical protein
LINLVGTIKQVKRSNDKRFKVLLNEDHMDWTSYWDEESNELDPTLVKEEITTEVLSLDNFDVYALQLVAERPQGSTVLSTRWVLKLEDMALVKARLVVRGYEQAFTDTLTSSPTPSLTTLLTLLTLAVSTDLVINTGDVSTAFLHATLKEEVFVLPPPELVGTDHCPTGYCWKLKKALYGLRGAPLAWNRHLSTVLTEELKFKRCSTDSCLYVHLNEKTKAKMYLLLYVDDLLLLSETTADSDWFFTELGKRVLLKHTGTFSPDSSLRFLGRHLTHRGDNILVQSLPNFIDGILHLYNLNDAKPLTTTGSTHQKIGRTRN